MDFNFFYTYLSDRIIKLLYIISCCIVPYIKITEKWKSESYCRIILSTLTGYKFVSIRPNWLKNPYTGKNLELDCYNDDLRLALEYNGKQHYEHVKSFHRSIDDFEMQIYRDNVKKALCKYNNVILIIVPYTISRYSLCSYILNKLYMIKHRKKQEKL